MVCPILTAAEGFVLGLNVKMFVVATREFKFRYTKK